MTIKIYSGVEWHVQPLEKQMRGRRAWPTDLPPIEQRCHSATGRGAHRMAQPVALLLLTLSIASAEILTPPYFNLAQGKKVTATATCGDEGTELYCKLVGANADHDEHVIQGQVSAKRLFESPIMCTLSNERINVSFTALQC